MPRDAGSGEVAPSDVPTPAEAGLDAAPLDAGGPVGLAERPSNATCRSPLVPEVGTEGLPRLLSETGCFQPQDPARPLPALVPYEVNAPLWSDGADKDRWLALPDGARIEITPDGDFELPPGAVTIKLFSIGGRRVETRFFVRGEDGQWSGYTYAWNEAGTDAEVLDEGAHERQFGDVVWRYPSRADCTNCHTPEAGFSLGLETAQLDRMFTYPGGQSASQLATFAHIGFLASALSPQKERPPVLPDPADEGAPLEARARGYLHANCANCHRGAPGSGSGMTDFRFTTALNATMACDVEPRADSLGVPNPRVIAPGDPSRSMVVVRMLELGRGRMPEIGTAVVDQAGVALVSDWIQSLAACP